MADLTKCAKCGACTSVCPVYQHTGQESLTARGRIHLLSKLTGQKQTNRFKEIFSKCLLCGACYQACPRDIDTPTLIIQAREKYGASKNLTSFKKLLIQKSFSHPALLPTLKTGSNLLAGLLPQESGLRLKLSLFNDVGPKPKRSFINSLKQESTPTKDTRQVAYFTGCLANYLQQDIATASIACLKKLTNTVAIAPSDQTCCGMAGIAAGAREDAISLAKKNINAFNKPAYIDLEIFTSCATCFAQLKSYPNLLAHDPEWNVAAEKFARRVCEFSTYLLFHIAPNTAPKTTETKELRVFYHDPCHLRFPKHSSEKIVAPPRKLLNMLPEINITELACGPRCCGQGGLFNIAHPKTSKQIREELLSFCQTDTIQIITTTCSGCLIQITEGLALNKSKTKAVHLAILLNDNLHCSLAKIAISVNL